MLALLFAQQDLSLVASTNYILLGQTVPLSDGWHGPFSTGAEIPIGLVGPDAILSVAVTSASVSLTSVTSATLTAIDGALSQHLPWTASVGPAIGNSAVIPSAAQLTYAPLLSDVQVLGRWRLEIQLNFADGGNMPCVPIFFDVVDQWGRH